MTKVIHLFFDDPDYEELKKVKKREGIKSWVKFFMLMKDYSSKEGEDFERSSNK